jgi:hypothetical protein
MIYGVGGVGGVGVVGLGVLAKRSLTVLMKVL